MVLSIVYIALVTYIVILTMLLAKMRRQLDHCAKENARILRIGRKIEALLVERERNTIYTIKVHPTGNGDNRSAQIHSVRGNHLRAFHIDAPNVDIAALRAHGPIDMMVTHRM